MTFGISPGVYPIETNQSVYVPSLATTAAAIVIQSSKGPANQAVLITSAKQFTDTYGAPLPAYLSMYAALTYLQAGNALWVYRVTNSSTVATIPVVDTAGSPATTFVVNASSPGLWGNGINVTFATNPSVANTFKLIVTVASQVVETWIVSKSQTLLDGFGKSLYIQNVINGNSKYISIADVTSDALAPNLSQSVSLAGGTDESGSLSDGNINNAYNTFASVETYHISMFINAGWDTAAIQDNLITLAQTRTDCIALLDMPIGQTTTGNMVTYVGTISSSTYAAIYAGWPQIYDSFNDVNLYAPPSGFAAQVMAFSANVSSPWAAPAGMNRGSLPQALGVNIVFAAGDRDVLYAAAINPIQMFTGQGVMIYGQKTLTQVPSALDRINVRMLMVTIEKNITAALRPFVFEANNTFTQDNISSIISSYMDTVKAGQGVYDYLVVCNGSNNKPATVQQNQLFCDLYVKPTITAEFIRLNAIISATGVSFSSSST